MNKRRYQRANGGVQETARSPREQTCVNLNPANGNKRTDTN